MNDRCKIVCLRDETAHLRLCVGLEKMCVRSYTEGVYVRTQRVGCLGIKKVYVGKDKRKKNN